MIRKQLDKASRESSGTPPANASRQLLSYKRELESRSWVDGAVCSPTPGKRNKWNFARVVFYHTSWLYALGLPADHRTHDLPCPRSVSVEHWGLFATCFMRAMKSLPCARFYFMDSNKGSDLSKNGDWKKSQRDVGEKFWFSPFTALRGLPFEWLAAKRVALACRGWALCTDELADMNCGSRCVWAVDAWNGIVPDIY